MKTFIFIIALSLLSTNAFAGKSFGCIWAEAKLETAIQMQKDYEEKQRYYKEENGYKSDNYEIQIELAKEDEREARAEVRRKCE